MDATTETTQLERTLSIEASPETVWEFFVDPEKMKRWMGMDITVEPQPGGIYRCVVIPGHTCGRPVRRARTASPARLHVGLGT